MMKGGSGGFVDFPFALSSFCAFPLASPARVHVFLSCVLQVFDVR